ncbi:pentapeptide repeat-containing protein [Stenotrophomonas rhizophila]|uniref:pentapeptide repeat-containing protein n=1 Tax=Stenotrophomonas rhizophila TaxID=216778 RepID=UPI0028D4CD4A|nr:pentapeptide repeat-containing protein [Stenotrophomonas rhizophila]
MLAKEARNRWQTEQLKLVEKKLSDAAKSLKMGPMPESPFGLTELGMADYRGATLAEPVRYLKVSNVDLSDVLFKEGASINESELDGCRLDRIDMRNVFVRRRFSDCSFVKAKLPGARLGGEFVRCDFTGANLSKSFATDCKFTGCNFAGATLSDVHFISCTFDGCDFSGVKLLTGSVAGSKFLGGTSIDQLAGCITENVVIR